ncbi:MAG: Telomerase Cajal body protein 1 [Marteilia pararefringens]
MNSHDGFPIAQCQPHADLLHFTAHSSPNCLTRRHFLKFCNFSPDSSTLLRYDSCNQITIESVEKIFESSAVAASDNAQISSSSSSILSISDTILSVDWFPLYDCQQAITKCFAVSSISTPIQIWDANYLQIRASYKLYRQQSDTLLHPNALCFSADGSRLFAGMKNSFAIFDTANPGSDFQEFVIYNRALDYGLGGLICCFGRTPQMPNVLAVATYDKQCISISRNFRFKLFLSYVLIFEAKNITACKGY